MSVNITINNKMYSYDYIIEFEKINNKTFYKPAYINQNETIDTTHYNVRVTELSYTYRLTNYEKWIYDQALRSHNMLNVTDEINGFIGTAWITNIETEWNPINAKRPWEYTIKMISNDII